MLSVGYGNGIHFRTVKDSDDLPNFDNTFLNKEYGPNKVIYKQYLQKYYTTDEMIVQAVVGTGDTFAFSYTVVATGTTTPMSPYLPPNLAFTTKDYYQVRINFSTWAAGTVLYFTATNSTTGEVWRSECVQVVDKREYLADNDSDKPRLLKIEWVGVDAQFGCNYQGDIPIGGISFVPFMNMEASLGKYEPKIEQTVYENQDEVTKLYEKVKRTLTFESDALPMYMLEKLVVASAHDYFWINEAAYVREDAPELNNFEGSNTGTITLILTQVNVVGLNTDDVDFDCDSVMTDCKIVNIKEEGVTANTSFSIPEDYLLHSIIVSHSGLPATNSLIKFGRTVGGDEIGTVNASPNAIGTYHNNPKTLTKHLLYSESGTATLYADVSGTSPNANITINLISLEE